MPPACSSTSSTCVSSTIVTPQISLSIWDRCSPHSSLLASPTFCLYPPAPSVGYCIYPLFTFKGIVTSQISVSKCSYQVLRHQTIQLVFGSALRPALREKVIPEHSGMMLLKNVLHSCSPAHEELCKTSQISLIYVHYKAPVSGASWTIKQNLFDLPLLKHLGLRL